MSSAITRRSFLQWSGLSGSLLILGYLPGDAGSNRIVVNLKDNISVTQLNQFIAIDSNGSVILFSHRPEMGQGTFQSIPMILAEELEVSMDQVVIKPAPANRELYGSQIVVGSRSIQTEFDKLRLMGAAAREMLVTTAAKRWGISTAECKVSDGIVYNHQGASFKYGELVEEASKSSVPKSPKLKEPADFKIVGQPLPRRDIPLKTNGEAIFGLDVQVPGMLYATIERCPYFSGLIADYNRDEILELDGVEYILETSRDLFGNRIPGVAILSKDYWSAFKARKALKVKWDSKGREHINQANLQHEARRAARKPGNALFSTGDADKLFDGASDIIEASYETPYQAHVPMEPMNAIVHVREDGASFWGSTQNPNGMRSFLAEKYNLAPDKIDINYTFIGGGFGRRSRSDVVEEAADLSHKVKAPVKVVWTREDDQTQGPFRACSLNICRAVLNQTGKIIAFEHKVVAQEIRNQTGDDLTAGRQLMGGINVDYKIPNYSIKGVLLKRYIPISYWRAVYHSTNPFAQECFIDELAHRAGVDPLQYRLNMLDHPRYRRVLKEVALATDWDAPTKADIGRGVAVVERSGAYFAMVIEVARNHKGIRPTKVTTVIDLGICINPDTVKAQTEGSIIMGLGAVYAGLTVEQGAIAEKNFNTYPLLTMSQCPEIETIILNSDAPPDGAGEAGLPTVAPALANAIFDLTGTRIRSLPLDLDALG